MEGEVVAAVRTSFPGSWKEIWRMTAERRSLASSGVRTGCCGPSCSATTAIRLVNASDSLFHWSRNQSWSLLPPLNVQFKDKDPFSFKWWASFTTVRRHSRFTTASTTHPYEIISSVKCGKFYNLHRSALGSHITVTHRLHVGRAAVRRRHRTRGWARGGRHRTHRHRPVVTRRPDIYI